MFKTFKNRTRGKFQISKLLDRLKLNKKFMVMYIICVIMPLVLTDAILFRSIYTMELDNQSHSREKSIDAYATCIANILSYDANLASAMDINKNLNSFINTWYSQPYEYYDELVGTITRSYFSTLSDLNQDRIVIYSDNPTMLSGNYFHHISEVANEDWYKKFSVTDKNEAVYAYYENNPALKTFDQNRFIYVRRMNSVRSVSYTH